MCGTWVQFLVGEDPARQVAWQKMFKLKIIFNQNVQCFDSMYSIIRYIWCWEFLLLVYYLVSLCLISFISPFYMLLQLFPSVLKFSNSVLICSFPFTPCAGYLINSFHLEAYALQFWEVFHFCFQFLDLLLEKCWIFWIDVLILTLYPMWNILLFLLSQRETSISSSSHHSIKYLHEYSDNY